MSILISVNSFPYVAGLKYDHLLKLTHLLRNYKSNFTQSRNQKHLFLAFLHRNTPYSSLYLLISFSFFPFVESRLKELNITFAKLNGSMTLEKRKHAITVCDRDIYCMCNILLFLNKNFKETSCNVFLISLKTGGMGLNLIEANYVIFFFFLAPFNIMFFCTTPAFAEDQAIDRCHRIGQTKAVTITKFIMQVSFCNFFNTTEYTCTHLCQGTI
jgi:hypothetical protein